MTEGSIFEGVAELRRRRCALLRRNTTFLDLKHGSVHSWEAELWVSSYVLIHPSDNQLDSRVTNSRLSSLTFGILFPRRRNYWNFVNSPSCYWSVALAKQLEARFREINYNFSALPLISLWLTPGRPCDGGKSMRLAGRMVVTGRNSQTAGGFEARAEAPTRDSWGFKEGLQRFKLIVNWFFIYFSNAGNLEFLVPSSTCREQRLRMKPRLCEQLDHSNIAQHSSYGKVPNVCVTGQLLFLAFIMHVCIFYDISHFNLWRALFLFLLPQSVEGLNECCCNSICI